MPSTHPTLDANANRLGPLLGFQPSVEARFERETQPRRVQEMRRAVFIGLVFFNLYSLASIVLMPDIWRLSLLLRLGVITPTALGIAWSLDKVSPATREQLALGGSIGAALVPVVLLWASRAPEAAYTAGDVTLSLLYSTMMLVLRFPHALIMVGTVMAVAVPSYYLKAGNSAALAHALVLQFVCASAYLLIGNYSLQRNARMSYLSTMQAVLQSATLELDKTELQRLSHADPLTGLANRRRLSKWLAAWQAGGAGDRSLAVIMVDVDHFKRYNDAHGHPAGDVCLTRIAQAMAGCLRDDRDLLARYGGEEFAVLLPGADAAEASMVAQRLCDAVQALDMPHVRRDDGMSVVTVSAGVASMTVTGRRRTRALFEAADAALYMAKQRGRNQQRTAVTSEPSSAATPSDLAPLSPDGW